MAALALEIEKLHGELANAEKRARAAVAAANPGDCLHSILNLCFFYFIVLKSAFDSCGRE